MERNAAARVLIAAGNDPRLAAWVSVLHEYNLSPDADVSTLDHWQAYEELFVHDLISANQYDQAGIRKELAGYRPSSYEVNDVLASLANHDPQEAFVTKVRSLAHRENPSGLSRFDDDLSFDTPQHSLSSFEHEPAPMLSRGPQRQPMPYEDEFGAFEAPRPAPQIPQRHSSGIDEIVETMTCLRRGCNSSVQLKTQHANTDDIPHDTSVATLHEYIVAGTCQRCGAEYMTSVDLVVRAGR